MCAPEDGTSYEVGATAICKGAKHPNLAKKFIDFATSAECVELGQKNGSYQFLVVDGAFGDVAKLATVESFFACSDLGNGRLITLEHRIKVDMGGHEIDVEGL